MTHSATARVPTPNGSSTGSPSARCRSLTPGALVSEGEEPDVDLDVTTGNQLVIALGVNFARARSVRQSANAVAPEDPRHTGGGDYDAVTARPRRAKRGAGLEAPMSAWRLSPGYLEPFPAG